MKFHAISLGGRPLLEIPAASLGLRRAAVACYPGHTLKKRILRRMVTFGFCSGILPLLRPARDFSPPGMTVARFEEWVGHLAAQLDEPVLHPVVIWPGDPRRGRLYFYFLNGDGTPLVFAKLALDEANEWLVRNEAEVLARFCEEPPKTFRVPEVKAAGNWDGAEYLVTSCLPKGARAVDLQIEKNLPSVLAEVDGPPRHRPSDQPPPWWRKAVAACRSHPAFKDSLRKAVTSGWTLCRIHGDLNRTNLLRTKDELWLIDWEQSRADGPRRADELCLEIDRWWNRHPNPGGASRRQFLTALFEGKSASHRAELILAFAFLHLLQFSPATALLEEWTEES